MSRPPDPEGRFVDEDGVWWYRIDHYDRLDPFLMTVVAPDDQWVYVSSSGALTAGRRSAEHSLFPYETDDRLHRSGGITGPLTIIRVDPAAGRLGDGPGEVVWEPFAPWARLGRRRRSLAKSTTGDRLRFEEHDPDLGLTFRATWAPAGELGLTRRCQLVADGARPPVEVELLDGLVDVLPAGVALADQQSASTLVDGYRRSELDPETGLALFTLEARVSDKADPAEALTANVVWADGLDAPVVALSDRQVAAFRAGRSLEPEHLVTGRKGAFLVSTGTSVGSGHWLDWVLAADVAKDHVAVAALRHRLAEADDLMDDVDQALERSTSELLAIVDAADGLQATADRRATVHHFANTLFNAMRGGVFLDDHRVGVDDVGRFVAGRNRAVVDRFGSAVAGLDRVVELDELRAAVADDADLTRLVGEYLPLVFSRRHGDPSRPWNRFTIPARDPDGGPARGYEGNWRDIFQNWEALVHSFPGYAPSVVAKFLNASTLDGHNPYRLTDRGIDWERPEEGSWGNFGYWGDHQIVYLHRLLDTTERFHPGLLASQLDTAAHSFADVPYRIVPYADLVADPKRTLVFDEARQARADGRAASIGADGLLVPAAGDHQGGDGSAGGGVHHATLAEKLVIPALAKLSNLVAGAGIWMNTQRPEWNDANNALVGNGVSTVTLLQLRDYLVAVDRLLAAGPDQVRLSRPVQDWLTGLAAAFAANEPTIPTGPDGDEARRSLLDDCGRSFEAYRSIVYDVGPGAAVPMEVDELRRLLAMARPHLDHAAEVAERSDGLVHAYWLLRLEPGVAAITPLPEMLEGQAAVLDSPATDPADARRLVDALFASDLHRPDQRSFVLYPNRPPPPFVDKNRVPDELVGPAIEALLDHRSANRDRDGEPAIVARDVDGVVRFDPALWSGRQLDAAIDELADDPTLGPVIAEGRDEIAAAYESVFDHRSFTGRSGTMYRYEGLGSVYWHMVSKVLFGVQERALDAADRADDPQLVSALIERYHRIRSGLGFLKPVTEQGTFPTDPHSHTPAGGGAKQPGMTGQVKEGVLLRWRELGLLVEDGCVRFRPILLDPAEFLVRPEAWAPLGEGVSLDAGTLGFTWCGVPFVYRLTDEPGVAVTWSDGRLDESAESALDRLTSRALFARTGRIARIDVGVAAGPGRPVQPVDA